jgi:hypothetical protein
MPELCRFFGIVITMHYREHGPPHFHARYGKHKVAIGVDPLTVLRGTLPPRGLSLVMEWAARHKTELIEDWRLAERQEALRPIEPLE